MKEMFQALLINTHTTLSYTALNGSDLHNFNFNLQRGFLKA